LVSHIMLVPVRIVFASYELTENPLIGLLSYHVLPYSFQKKGVAHVLGGLHPEVWGL
jgi:hypothetical protein